VDASGITDENISGIEDQLREFQFTIVQLCDRACNVVASVADLKGAVLRRDINKGNVDGDDRWRQECFVVVGKEWLDIAVPVLVDAAFGGRIGCELRTVCAIATDAAYDGDNVSVCM
jgi:hypothetical protein